jgi:hypothetical protein
MLIQKDPQNIKLDRLLLQRLRSLIERKEGQSTRLRPFTRETIERFLPGAIYSALSHLQEQQRREEKLLLLRLQLMMKRLRSP